MDALGPIQRFFIGWRFPVLMIATVLFVMLGLLAILLIPDTAGAAGAFAEDFKVWCFGYDPASGALEWAYVWMFLVQPLVLVGVVLLVWAPPLREILRTAPARIAPYVGGAFAVVCGLGAALTLAAGPAPDASAEAPFPAERIRTAHEPAPFALTDQDGQTLTLEMLRGRVLLVTAVYARCGYTCPMILAQTRRVLAGLTPAEREGLSVVAITLDPEHDTPDVLKLLAQAQQVEPPLFHAVTGVPDSVHAVLDRYGFARTRDPETGVIDHTNLFVVIDRGGRIAYRFSLGERQEAWLAEALHLLLQERGRA